MMDSLFFDNKTFTTTQRNKCELLAAVIDSTKPGIRLRSKVLERFQETPPSWRFHQQQHKETPAFFYDWVQSHFESVFC